MCFKEQVIWASKYQVSNAVPLAWVQKVSLDIHSIFSLTLRIQNMRGKIFLFDSFLIRSLKPSSRTSGSCSLLVMNKYFLTEPNSEFGIRSSETIAEVTSIFLLCVCQISRQSVEGKVFDKIRLLPETATITTPVPEKQQMTQVAPII